MCFRKPSNIFIGTCPILLSPVPRCRAKTSRFESSRSIAYASDEQGKAYRRLRAHLGDGPMQPLCTTYDPHSFCQTVPCLRDPSNSTPGYRRISYLFDRRRRTSAPFWYAPRRSYERTFSVSRPLSVSLAWLRADLDNAHRDMPHVTHFRRELYSGAKDPAGQENTSMSGRRGPHTLLTLVKIGGGG